MGYCKSEVITLIIKPRLIGAFVKIISTVSADVSLRGR